MVGMADIAIPRPLPSNYAVKPLQPNSRRASPRPELSVKIADRQVASRKPVQTPLATPVSILTPPLTPQSSFGSTASSEGSEGESFPNFLRAFYPYHPEKSSFSDIAQSTVTLSINEGDVILVHSVQPNGWADGTLLRRGARGWLPTNYCESYDHDMMRNLLRAFTNVWDFFRGHEQDDLKAFRSQDYARGMIAGVRTLLERSGCLSRDSEPVLSQQGIRSLRKALLADLSGFAKKAQAVQEACRRKDVGQGDSGPEERGWLYATLDEIVLKAMKVVTRAVRFLDLWQRVWEMKHAAVRGEKSLPLGVAPGPSPTTLTRTTGPQPHTNVLNVHTHVPATLNTDISSPSESENRLVQESASHASPAAVSDPSPVSASDPTGQNVYPTQHVDAESSCHPSCPLLSDHLAEATQSDAEPHSARHKLHTPAAAKRASASHRLSHTVRDSPTSNHALASHRLCTTHESFLGFIGAFIGLHLQSRRTMELLVTTQQSVLACQALLDVVQEIWERDFRRSDVVDASRMAMHARLAELVNATKDIFQATQVAGDDDVFCLPEQSKRLVDAATACVRSAGDCVTKSRAVIERTGDFEVEPEEKASSPQGVSPLSPHTKPAARPVTPSATRPATPRVERDAHIRDARSSSSTPPYKRRTRAVPEPPSRPAPSRPAFQRSVSAQSEENMPSARAIRARGSSLIRTTTINRKPSETGLRRAGTRAVRTTGSASSIPTLGIESSSSTDPSPVDSTSTSTSHLHPRNAGSESSLPHLDANPPPRPRTAHAGSVSNLHPRQASSASHLPRIDTAHANRHPTIDVDIPRTSFFDMSNTPTNSSPEDHLKLELSPLPLSLQNTPDTAMIPPAAATHFERINSGGESIADSVATKNSSARHSGESAMSHVSTRATTPDHAAHKTSSDESLQESVTSAEEERAKTNELESQLLAETHAHELTFNGDGQVTGGSLSALVERMTSHDSTPDALFVNTFYLTFRLFTTPVEVAQTLIDRYECAGDDREYGHPVRLRIYNVFKSWMEAYWNPETDGEALTLIYGFANGRLRFDLPSASARLVELYVHLQSTENQSNSPNSLKVSQAGFGRPRALSGAHPSPEATAPAPNVSKGQLNALRSSKGGASACTILDFDALELARQFTIMQSKIFCTIQPEELLALEWTKKTDSKGVNVKAMIALSTDLTNLVADTILQLELKKRAVMIKHWVKIASKCLELSNYDALMAIISSLNSSIVLRLKKTWDLVSPKTLGKLDYLKTVVDVSRNYFVLRQRLHGHIAPCLPFVGIYLTDLTFIDCGNQATRQHPSGGNNQTIINFDKYIKTTKVIGDLQRFQVPYKLVAIPEMQDWMQSQINRVRYVEQGNVQNYYRRSLMLEPREGSNPPPPPPAKQTPSESVQSPVGGQQGKELNKDGSSSNRFEFWSGLGLSLNKEKSQN